jgi:hypothetical protein
MSRDSQVRGLTVALGHWVIEIADVVRGLPAPAE